MNDSDENCGSTAVPLQDTQTDMFLIAAVGQKTCALPVNSVIRCTRAAAIETVPGNAGDTLGVLDVHGEVLPVLNLHRILGVPTPSLSPDQRFIIVEHSNRRVVFVADGIRGVTRVEGVSATFYAAANGKVFLGTVRHGDDLVMLCSPQGLVGVCDTVLMSPQRRDVA